VKLLFDANLSPRLPLRLLDLFPGSTHVFAAGIPEGTPDQIIWEFAKENDFIIVTSDSDYNALEVRRGHPPYIVWLQRMDYPTRAAVELIRRNAIRIHELEGGDQGVLILRVGRD